MKTPQVSAFTDTYLPTVNGVSYTVQMWHDRWRHHDGTMHVVYPHSSKYEAGPDEYPVRSFPFPLYDGFRLGMPQIPAVATTVDIVHSHTPFSVGLGGLRLARRREIPFVASYHTPTSEYADYVTTNEHTSRLVRSLATQYESWFLSHADAIICPSYEARRRLQREIDPSVPLHVLSNGIDTTFFRPVCPTEFCESYDLTDRPLIGYTGRHGYEKNLQTLIRAAASMDGHLVIGGDGPARENLESLAERLNVDVTFLGFLPREELPAFYSALDTFVFPSPVETQGLVALESIACGTPVVAVDAGALSETITDGETGYHYPHGNIEACRQAVYRALENSQRLKTQCIESRSSLSVNRVLSDLADIYRHICSYTDSD
jgi:glycosyltransferase involved in cell wall biosynthesis